jgi:D-alanine-D-alanine ligase
MKNVAVFFGGVSVEHDISIITGVLTANSIDKKYEVIPVYVDKSGNFYTGKTLLDPDAYKNLDYKKLKKVTLLSGSKVLFEVKNNRLKRICEIAVAINCMHGERGEDGTLSALLNLSNIPLASPNMVGSAICMNKSITKIMLKGLGIPCLDYAIVTDIISAVSAEKLSYPLIVKPTTGGSSIGVSKAKNRTELEFATLEGLRYSDSVIIEPLLENFIEINCACFRDADGNLVVSECEKPIGKEEVLTFSDKYENGKREFPAKIDKEISDKIKKLTAKIYRELEFKGVIRIDYFVKENKVYVNEINTVPGSLAYYLFCANTQEFTKMLSEMIEFGIISFNKSSSITKTFNSNIISSLKPKGSKNIRN